MSKRRTIWCCGCDGEVEARLTDGREIYPQRADLAAVPFWRCDACRNHVGCHHKTRNPTRPLGCIPTNALRQARQHVHRLLDPIWRSGRMSRRDVYAQVAQALDIREYHTAEIRSVEDARRVYAAVRQIAAEAEGARL